MANLVIYNRLGETIQATATITKAEQSTKLLSEDVISLEVGAKETVPFAIGDYIEWCGHTYTLNQLPSVAKKNSADFQYSTVTFEGEQYELLDSAWLLPSNTYGDSFTGDLKDFLDIIIENAARSGKAWSLGEYPAETGYKTLTYTQTNCLHSLQNVCKEWGVEFYITRNGAERVLNIKKQIGELFPQRFEYGRTGGAYKIERRTVSGQNVTTRLFVFGSDKNLPPTYRENKLCLPGKTRNESYITDDESVNFYGIKENVKHFTDIFPARYGTVTGIDAENEKIFYDTSMDFDLNEKDSNGTKWLIPSAVAKIQFNSGGLAGYSFDLVAYDHALKQFRIKTYTDANGLQFPNPESAAFKIKVGDEYFITDIRVPQSYIDAAETKLQTEGQKYFEENCKPKVNYTIDLSPFFLRHLYGDTKNESVIFKVGDFIEVYDFDLEIGKKLRIVGFTRNLLKPYEFTLTIAENVEARSTFQRIVSELTDVKSIIYTNNITAADDARRNWLATQDVANSVFDPDGNYYSEKIKPLSIETWMLSVGARSQQYVIKDVNFEPNYGGNPNAIANTAGTLEHYTVAEPDIRTWQINRGTTTLQGCPHNHIHGETTEKTVYHIYAVCPRTGVNGFIEYDCANHAYDENPQYYYFLIGTLTSVISDVDGKRAARNIALTYGSTSINGRFINTGRIESADKSVYIDLDNNEISGRFNFKDGLISNVVGIGVDASNAEAGLGGINKHPGDDNLTSIKNKAIALWAKKIMPQVQNLEYVAADTVIMRNGAIRVRSTSNLSPFRSDLVFFADPTTGKVTMLNTEIEDLRFNDGTAKTLTVSQTLTLNQLQVTDAVASPLVGETSHIKGVMPLILWMGLLQYYAPTTKYSAYRKNGGNFPTATSCLTITTAERLSEGRVRLTFDRNLEIDRYFITAQGAADANGENTAYVTVESKSQNKITLKVSDDSTLNDFDFYLQIWYV